MKMPGRLEAAVVLAAGMYRCCSCHGMLPGPSRLPLALCESVGHR